MKHFEPEQFRQHFPLILKNKLSNSQSEKCSHIVYFDNGATTQKPDSVIECNQHFYQNINANVHRASHSLSTKATTAFEQARHTVKTFINAKNIKELRTINQIDGFLIGGASQNSNKFIDIIKKTYN